jgi:hypothetical protein
MKPLAARACARPLTAPSTMTLLGQPHHARCAINGPIHRSLTERARSRSSAGYRPATLALDSLVGSLAACPIPSLRWRKTDSNHRSLRIRDAACFETIQIDLGSAAEDTCHPTLGHPGTAEIAIDLGTRG